MASAPSPVLFTGPLFLGSLFNWSLFGVLILQVYIFSVSFPHESLKIKCLVYGLLLLDTVQTVTSTTWVWSVLVLGWGDPAVLAEIPWSSTSVPILAAIVSAIVQFFFAWRIWSLKGNHNVARVMVALIILIALMQSISSIYGAVRSAQVPTVAEFAALTPFVEVWLAGSFTCDILIALSMTYILVQARRASPFKETETMITKLIILTVETGTITAVTACVELILFLKMDSNFVHLVPALLLGKMYTNVLVATLNGRTRNKSSVHTGSNTARDNYQLSRVSWRKHEEPLTSVGTAVHVSTMVTDDGNNKLKYQETV